MNFIMPSTNEGKIQMYSESLARVKGGIQQITSMKMQLEPELIRKQAIGEDAQDLLKAKKNLRLQELCLTDQEQRLQDRITCLQIGY